MRVSRCVVAMRPLWSCVIGRTIVELTEEQIRESVGNGGRGATATVGANDATDETVAAETVAGRTSSGTGAPDVTLTFCRADLGFRQSVTPWPVGL